MTPDQLAISIVEALEEGAEREANLNPRCYIGGSNIGGDCDASVAYSLRGFPDDPTPGRLTRIFRDGHAIEDMVLAELRKHWPYAIFSKDHNGRQYSFSLYGGHVRGNVDGKIADPDDNIMLLEVKSSNDDKFKSLTKRGVKETQSGHYRQMMLYMGGIGLKRALYFTYNKNTSEHYAEVVEFDEVVFQGLLGKAEAIMDNQASKISEDQTGMACRFCRKSQTCAGKVAPVRVCRTCNHSKATHDGGWYCELLMEPCGDPCEEWKVYEPVPTNG